MTNLATYYHKYDGDGLFILKPLNITGKWKLETGPYYDGYKLFIQHQGLVFKYWIDESDIYFGPEITSVEYSCSKY